jgi:hypothetical protein
MHKEYARKLSHLPAWFEKYWKGRKASAQEVRPDPYYGDSYGLEDDDDDDEEEEEMTGGDKKKKASRYQCQKETGGTSMRRRPKVSQKNAITTIITGMETVPGAKLKDVSKLSKKWLEAPV